MNSSTSYPLFLVVQTSYFSKKTFQPKPFYDAMQIIFVNKYLTHAFTVLAAG